jgi:hypothetical protein
VELIVLVTTLALALATWLLCRLAANLEAPR